MKINLLNSCNLKINKFADKDKACDNKALNSSLPKQIENLTNIYYSPLSFGRTLEEHKSWGATVNSKGVNFKLFTFPDVKEVKVLIKKSNGSEIKIPMGKNGTEGIYEKQVPRNQVAVGDKYMYEITKKDGTVRKVKDPYSLKQESLLGFSIIYDHKKYQWQDQKWTTNKNSAKISRIANKNNSLNNMGNLRIYELNLDTLTRVGTLDAAKNVIKKMAKDKTFNTVEIMPVENTPSFNWGYDGVDKFAVAQRFGGPDKLKKFIDFAHQNNINVIMDMVPNHLGPDGAMLESTGPYISGNNGWGGAFNYESEHNKYVRDFMVNAALNWVQDFHCDGIRFDMTKFMGSDNAIKQIAAEVHHHNPHAFLIAEDAREHEGHITRPLTKNEECRGKSPAKHCKVIEKIAQNKTSLDNLGMDSEWAFDFHHQLAAALLGVWDNTYKNMGSLKKAAQNSVCKVKYVMSHDEIGNWDGTRLINKLMVQSLDLPSHITAYDNSQRGMRSAHAAQAILKAFTSGSLEKMTDTERNSFYKKNNIIQDSHYLNNILSLENIEKAYERAFSKQKAALGTIYTIPGPKMVFQGDESANLSYFKFFRDSCFDDKEGESAKKGYEIGKKALDDSKLSSFQYGKNKRKYARGMSEFVKDLNILVEKNRALQDGYLQNTEIHNDVNINHIKSKDGRNEIFAVMNYSNMNYVGNYNIPLPTGTWEEVINSNDTKYGGNDLQKNKHLIKSTNNNKTAISLPKSSVVILRKNGI